MFASKCDTAAVPLALCSLWGHCVFALPASATHPCWAHKGQNPATPVQQSCNQYFRSARTLQRLITGCTSNVERRPIKASAPQTALKKLPQSLKWSQIISPASASPLLKQSTRRLRLVATCGAATRIIPLHSRAGPLQEMRLLRKNRRYLKINKCMNSCIFQIGIWLGLGEIHAMLWLPHPSHKKRRYNQKCINKSEDAANTASKRSDTDLGPALRKELARTVCEEELSSWRRERRGEERSDVAEVLAVMFRSWGGGG